MSNSLSVGAAAIPHTNDSSMHTSGHDEINILPVLAVVVVDKYLHYEEKTLKLINSSE